MSLQLKTKPFSSASGIYSNSVFETGSITLHGNTNGIGIFIDSGQDVIGDLVSGITYITHGALIVKGGVYMNNELYVNSDLTTNGNIQIGATFNTEQTLTMGITNTNDSWRMKKIDNTIRWEKFNTDINDWELMIRFSEC